MPSVYVHGDLYMYLYIQFTNFLELIIYTQFPFSEIIKGNINLFAVFHSLLLYYGPGREDMHTELFA